MPKRKKPQQEKPDASDIEASTNAEERIAGSVAPSIKASDDDEAEEGITHFKIAFNDKSIICERHGDMGTPPLIFTHGAGGGIAAPATRSFATGFAAVSPIVCFQGSMNLTNRIKYFHATIENENGAPINALGGRSMGARAAVLTALEMEKKPDALVLVSYPLMAGSKGEKREPERREKILTDLPEDVDVLFVVGSQDAQCNLEQLGELRDSMKARSWLVEVKGADHGMTIKPKAGVELIRQRSGQIAAEWLTKRDPERKYYAIEWDQDDEKISSDGWTMNTPAGSDAPNSKKRRTK